LFRREEEVCVNGYERGDEVRGGGEKKGGMSSRDEEE